MKVYEVEVAYRVAKKTKEEDVAGERWTSEGLVLVEKTGESRSADGKREWLLRLTAEAPRLLAWLLENWYDDLELCLSAVAEGKPVGAPSMPESFKRLQRRRGGYGYGSYGSYGLYADDWPEKAPATGYAVDSRGTTTGVEAYDELPGAEALAEASPEELGAGYEDDGSTAETHDEWLDRVLGPDTPR